MRQTIYFSPTFSCNLKCNYCLSKYNSWKEHINIKQLKLLLLPYLKWGKKIVFRWWEIFVYKYIKELFNFLINEKTEKGLTISFITNGVLVSNYIDEIEALLKKWNEVHITFSTDLNKKWDIKHRFHSESNYNCFLKSYSEVFNLRKKYSNLILLSSSVINWSSDDFKDFVTWYEFRKKLWFNINLYWVEVNNSNLWINNTMFNKIKYLYSKWEIIEDLIWPFTINELEYDCKWDLYNSEIYIKDFYNQDFLNNESNVMSNKQIKDRFYDIFSNNVKVIAAKNIIDFYLNKWVENNYYKKLHSVIWTEV